MLPYGRQSVDESDVAAVSEVLTSDWLTTGPTVTAFETELSRRAGGHRVVSCTSGTAALHIAYAALDLQPGDQVVTTPMTFVATASCASLAGGEVLFADVEDDTANVDPAAVAALLTERTRVVAAVDYAGHPCEYDALGALAADVGALTLADAAHSFGGSYRGRPVGDLADLTTLSFFPTKNLTTGEGGAVVAKDPGVARRAAEFHNIGLVRDHDRFELTSEGPWHQEVHAFGVNYRLTDVASALGLSQLRRLDGFKSRRQEIVDLYDAGLAGLDGLRTPAQRPHVDPMWHLYAVRILHGRRREVYERMRASEIGVQVNYLPVYWHPVYARMGYRRGMCPVAEQFYAEQLSLPLFPAMSDSDVHRVVDVLTSALRG